MKSIIKIAALSGICIAMVSGIAMAEQKNHRKGGDGQRFEKLDANSNGSLSVDEFVAAATSRFDKADTNSDGVLSEDELAQRMIRKRFEQRIARMIKRMDYNGDGKVTKDEIESRSRKRFALMDGNDDGKIEKSEMRRNSMRRGKGKHRGERRGMRHHRGMMHHRKGDRRHNKRMGEKVQEN